MVFSPTFIHSAFASEHSTETGDDQTAGADMGHVHHDGIGREAVFLAHEIGQWLNVVGLSLETLLMRLEKQVGHEVQMFLPSSSGKLSPDFKPVAGLTGQLSGRSSHAGRERAEDPLSAEEIFSHLCRTISSLQRARRLVEAMSRLERAGPDLGLGAVQPKQRFQPVASVYSVIHLLMPGLREQGILISLRVSCPGHRECVGSGELFEQVLINLIGNARDTFATSKKAILKGFVPQIRIAVLDVPGARPDDGQVHIRIFDNAGGILVRPVERVFEERFTFGKDGGHCGLGLAFCREVIAKLGGTIMVRNVGKGACFEISLPMVRENGEESDR